MVLMLQYKSVSTLVLLFMVLLITLPGCFASKIDREYLEGEWTTEKHEEGKIYFEGHPVTILFNKDSFIFREANWSDVVSNDPCNLNNAERSAKGTYSVNDNKIYLKGLWNKIPVDKSKNPCYDFGQFDLVYQEVESQAGILTLQLMKTVTQNNVWPFKEKITLYRK